MAERCGDGKWTICGLPHNGVAEFHGHLNDITCFVNCFRSSLEATCSMGNLRFTNIDVSNVAWSKACDVGETNITVLLDLLVKFGVTTQRFKAYRCGLDDTFIEHLVGYLSILTPECIPLEVHLSHNALTDVGFHSLVRVLEAKCAEITPTCPMWLRIEGNNISPESVRALVDCGRCCLAPGACNTRVCVEPRSQFAGRPALFHMRYGENQARRLLGGVAKPPPTSALPLPSQLSGPRRPLLPAIAAWSSLRFVGTSACAAQAVQPPGTFRPLFANGDSLGFVGGSGCTSPVTAVPAATQTPQATGALPAAFTPEVRRRCASEVLSSSVQTNHTAFAMAFAAGESVALRLAQQANEASPVPLSAAQGLLPVARDVSAGTSADMQSLGTISPKNELYARGQPTQSQAPPSGPARNQRLVSLSRGSCGGFAKGSGRSTVWRRRSRRSHFRSSIQSRCSRRWRSVSNRRRFSRTRGRNRYRSRSSRRSRRSRCRFSPSDSRSRSRDRRRSRRRRKSVRSTSSSSTRHSSTTQSEQADCATEWLITLERLQVEKQALEKRIREQQELELLSEEEIEARTKREQQKREVAEDIRSRVEKLFASLE
eukprot:TRINITY_DN56192_c0_g1_i1.p1 TRINITY_DN56192_c0_g1~~TRINITY_DN56192_c0_g1_i1.p1  ORF type:complete len:600 (-),score=65.92 TRINITY_DN56192_c0_g1_i1:232-2031(-)